MALNPAVPALAAGTVCAAEPENRARESARTLPCRCAGGSPGGGAPWSARCWPQRGDLGECDSARPCEACAGWSGVAGSAERWPSGQRGSGNAGRAQPMEVVAGTGVGPPTHSFRREAAVHALHRAGREEWAFTML
jgi:hypothetical protein